MNASSASGANVAYAAFVSGLALAASVLVLLLSATSATWLALVLLAAVALTAMVWSGDASAFLLFGFVLSAPIIVTKSLVTEGGVYAPGLEISLSDLFLLALLGAWLLERKVLARQRTVVTGFWMAASYFAWCWVSALSSSDLKVGALAALNLTKLFLVFFLMADLSSTAANLRRVLAVSAIGMALQICMAAAQFATGSELQLQGAKIATAGTHLVYQEAGGASAFRPSGFSLHPNVFAAYLVMLLPTVVLLALMASVHRRVRIVCCGLAVGGVAALLVTLSRGGWLSLAGALAFLAVVGCRMRLLRVPHVVLAGTFVGLLGVGVAVAYPTFYYRIFYSDQRAAEARLALFSQATMVIREAPLLGVGLGGYTRTSRHTLPPSFGGLSEGFRGALLKEVVHHKYAAVWAEQGVVGLILLLGIFVTSIWRFLRVRHWCDPTCAAIGLGIVAGLVGQLIFYNFEHFYTESRNNVLWLALGVLAGLGSLNERALAGSAPRS